MSEPVVVPSFPSNHVEALAMAYVQARVTPDATPEKVALLYLEAYDKIKKMLNDPD